MCSENLVEVFTPYITRKGKRVYKKDGGYYRFLVTKEKQEEYRKRKQQ
jgi:hypothetical protein